MVYVDTWLHITGGMICFIIFAITLQQICVTSIGHEYPKSIYRIMTSIMALVELLLHLVCSLWYESPSNVLSTSVHVLRLFSAIAINATFYPIIMTSIQHFYNRREYKDQLQIPRWLLSPWKYIVSATIIVCIVTYIIAFIHNSLSALFIYYIMADSVGIWGCLTLIAAMIDVLHKIQKNSAWLETRLETTKKQAEELEVVIKQNTNSGDLPTDNDDNQHVDKRKSGELSADLNKLTVQESISRVNTLELEKAKNEIDKGKYFIYALIFIVSTLLARNSYLLYSNIINKSYYDESTLATMPLQTVIEYLGSVTFVIIYDGGILIWLWKSTQFCRKIDHDTLAYKTIWCSYCSSKSPMLERVDTGLKDEPNEKKAITRRQTKKNNVKKGDTEDTIETTKDELVTDELGHTVDQIYNDETIADEREQTELPAMQTLDPASHIMLTKRPTVTPAPHGAGHIVGLYTGDLDDLNNLINCKIIIYLFDSVITSCSAAILYRKTSTQIAKMDENRFNKQFGGKQRIIMIQKHISEMSKGAILYCVTSKMNINTLQAIMQRLGLFKYFNGPIPKELIEKLNEINNTMGDRAISESQSPEQQQKVDSASPPPSKTRTKSGRSSSGQHIHVPSKLATLEEDGRWTPMNNAMDPNDGNDNDDDDDDDDNKESLPNIDLNKMSDGHVSPVREDKETDEFPIVTYDDIMSSIGDMKNMNRFKSDLSQKDIKIDLNIIKYEDDALTEEIKKIYEERLFAKNSDIMKETKGNAQINLLIFKFLEYYDVLNDEILLITHDQQTTSYFKSIGLCKGYHINGESGLNAKDAEEIQKYL